MHIRNSLLCLAICGAHSLGVTCSNPNFSFFQPGQSFNIGPAVYYVALNDPNYPSVANAIQQGFSSWNSHASQPANQTLIAGWSGYVSNSDCPSSQLVQIGNSFISLQLGALDFSNTTGCPALDALKNQHGATVVAENVLAFVDYNTWPLTNCFYPDCGTKSITFNLNKSWSVAATPPPSLYDVQSTLAHELGHTIGLTHQDNGSCQSNYLSQPCSSNQNKETMANIVHPGDTCQRDLTQNDIDSLRQAY